VSVRPTLDSACVFGGPATMDTVSVVYPPGTRNLDLYETLFRKDCRGSLVPVLANRWARVGAPNTWRIALDPGAAFADGTRLTAHAVKESWLRHEATAARVWADSVATSVRVLDTLTLEVQLLNLMTAWPEALADPTLAVSQPAPSRDPWEIGTGRYAANVAASSERALVAEPIAAPAEDRLPVLEFLAPSGDPRDALDLGVAVLVTRDSLAVEYAGDHPDYRVHRLEADRLYVLAAPYWVRAGPMPYWTAPDRRRPEIRGGLGPPFGPLAFPEMGCPTTGAIRPEASAPVRVVYPAGDPIARELAERIVALSQVSGDTTFRALPPSAQRARADGLDRTAFDSALARGAAVGFVFPVERFPFDPCAAAHALHRRMPWAAAQDLWVAAIPLRESSAYAIVRQGAGPMVVDWDRSVHPAVVR
jgi:hypothetical protein